MLTVESVRKKNIKVLVTPDTTFKTLLRTAAKYFMIEPRFYGFYNEKYSYISEHLAVSDYYHLIQTGGTHQTRTWSLFTSTSSIPAHAK